MFANDNDIQWLIEIVDIDNIIYIASLKVAQVYII